VIYSFTHDSVGVGEDGPTHQPIEQIMALRAIPGLTVIRPADAKETVAAWMTALNHDGPTALILSRQSLPIMDETNVEKAQNGQYTIREHDAPEATLIATGSEVSLCLEYADKHPVRVISMPSWELATSSELYLDRTIPSVSVEAGITLGWSQFADAHVGIDRFGASAPGNEVMHKLGISLQAIQDAITQ
jgi:transketolase